MASNTPNATLGVSGWCHIRAVLLLPVMNSVLIPAVLLWLARDYRTGAGGIVWLWQGIGGLLLVAGLSLVVRAIGLFVRRGRGTLAPWEPTRVLITEDVYGVSRNPMKKALFLVLIAECLLLGSTALAVWTSAFIAANVVYIRWFEEPGLQQRFGSAYAAYCERVPRWFGLGHFVRAGKRSVGARP